MSTPAKSSTDPSIAARVSPDRQSNKRAQFLNRREEIVDLAAKLFAQNGYDATGIRDIGEAAKLARGALYYYIESKESLLSDIHDRVLDPLLEQTQTIVTSDAPVRERIRQLSRALLHQVIDRHDHVWVFLHEYRSLSGERRERFRSKRSQFEGAIRKLLAEGQDNGEFVIGDVRLATLAFLGMHNYTYQWVGRSGSNLDPDTLSDFYCRVFFSGIDA